MLFSILSSIFSPLRRKRQLQKEDLLTNLPQEVASEILRRLPIRCIMRCRCVCKSWRNLIKGGHFKTSYACLAFVHRDMGYAVCYETFKPLCQFGLPPQNQCTTITPLDRLVVGSANGLLLVWDGCDDILFVCNPITSEYIELPRLPLSRCIFGFGMSKLGGQYKILCGNQNYRSYHVYNLGIEEGCWRSIVAPTCVPRVTRDNAVFLNGNLHWLASDLEENLFVCCFHLETELFTSFSLPPHDYSIAAPRNWFFVRGDYHLCVLEGRLCVCDSLKYPCIVIWSMNNYRDENSWVKAYTIGWPQFGEVVIPHKVLANSDLLIAIKNTGDFDLFIYNKNTDKCIESNGLLHQSHSKFYNIVPYYPSFLSLTAMGICHVKSLSFY